ncbi:glutaminyl-peptide cyclotransferase [Lentzea sp. NPDC004782]|uniref:glutaminyl-peptide cyclotransferase n=1 Tax=Lentzea sp. NPDC004782 TaxID=3154458 RepID=UPI0033B1780E
MTSSCVNGLLNRRLAFAALLAFLPSACASAASTPPHFAVSSPVTTTTSVSRHFHARVLDRVRTDRADARGLELVGDDLVEITGPTVRALSVSGGVRAQQNVPGAPADGGIALAPAGLWHLSSAFTVLRDPVTLAERRRAPASHETWGLCDDGTRLVQSDGTTRLLLRDHDTAALISEVRVASREWSTARLGDLACVVVNGYPQVWAVVSGTDWLIRVDLSTGVVTAVADLTAVTVAEQPTGVDDVVTGIAGAADELWVTGHRYGHRYRIRLQP